jgi:hypothetical protein
MATVPAPRDFARTTLRPRHRPLVRALAEAMFGHEDGPAPARLDAFVAEVDAFVSFASRTMRFGLLVMLELMRFAPVLLFYRLATFTRLTRDERARVLERMERSRLVFLTLVFAALKAIFCLVFFEQPEELAATGYSPLRRRHRRTGAASGAPRLPLVRTEAAE